nr:zinc finger protein [Colletotrichum truncatum]KAF6800837.1 zinc finger protein [Colletotrichum truncatum]
MSNLTSLSYRDQHKRSENGWNLLRTTTVSNSSGSTAHLLYLARNKMSNTLSMDGRSKDSEDDAGSDSDSTTSQSSSGDDSFSDDYGSEDGSESNDEFLNEETSKTTFVDSKEETVQDDSTDCLMVVTHENPPIIVKWTKRSYYWANAIAAIHPTLPLLALTHSPIQLELINLETEKRQDVNLPELADITETPAAYSRELKFSSCGNYLHVLLLSFFHHGHQGSSTKCVVKVSTFRFNWGSDRNSDILMREFQAQSCTFISAAHLGQMRTPLALTDWVDGCVFVALPPLTCDPKVLKIILPTTQPIVADTEAPATFCEESKDIFTLREQIYFPTSTPRRNPSLKYRGMANGSGGIYLALGALLPQPDKDESDAVKGNGASSQNPLQASAPVVLRWKVSEESGWRAWDVDADQKSSEAMEYWSIVAKLRGSFVDSEKSFTVPTRCGLNWDRKGYLSCS